MKESDKQGFSHVGIFIGSEFHARSLVESKTLNALLLNFKITIFSSPDIVNKFPELCKSDTIVSFIPDKKTNKLFAKQLRLGTLKFRKRSSSFRFRISRNILSDYWPEKKITSLISWVGKRLIRLIQTLSYFVVTSDYAYNKIQHAYYASILEIIPNSDIEDLKLDLIIGWCQTSEPSAIASILYAKQMKIPSVLVIDNWDNLSSKSIFGIEPTRVLCFGEQSIRFSEEIQKFRKGITYGVGSARFEVYRNLELSENRVANTIRILFAGSSIAMEDESILEFLNENLIAKKGASEKKFEVTYRRHPAPQGTPISLHLANLKYPFIRIDHSSTDESSWGTLPALCESLKRADVVIAMPTTFLLEARVCRLPVLVIAFDDKRIRTSSSRMIAELEHLKGISAIRGVTIVRNFGELKTALLNYDSLKNTANDIEGLNYFVSWDENTFAEKLTRNILDLLT
jgi:hypothetical protein